MPGVIVTTPGDGPTRHRTVGTLAPTAQLAVYQVAGTPAVPSGKKPIFTTSAVGSCGEIGTGTSTYCREATLIGCTLPPNGPVAHRSNSAPAPHSSAIRSDER